MKSKITSYVIYSIMGLMIAAIYFMNHTPETKSEYAEVISNSALIPGMIILCIYMLSLVNKEGIFDGLTYGVKNFVNRLIPSKNTYEIKSYGDYKLEKEEKRKDTHIEGLIVGLVFIVISIISYLIYKVI